MPAEYFYDYTQYAELHRERGAPDTTDLYVRRSVIGWNKTHNRLYFMAEVYDDIWQFHKDVTDSLAPTAV